MMDTTLLILILPIALIQIVLMIINLINLSKKRETKYLNKYAWLCIILFLGLIGNIVYLVIESEKHDSD